MQEIVTAAIVNKGAEGFQVQQLDGEHVDLLPDALVTPFFCDLRAVVDAFVGCGVALQPLPQVSWLLPCAPVPDMRHRVN